MQRLLKLDTNKVGVDYVVGDIHGAFSKLWNALERIKFDTSKDRLFCTGDLVDRGPESITALDWLAYSWFFSVRGNHEDMAINYPNAPGCTSDRLYIQNGGEWFLRLDKARRDLVRTCLSVTPLAIQVGDIGIIHAEPPSDWNDIENGEFPEVNAMWSRSKIQYKDTSNVQNIRKVYVGHTIVKHPVDLGNVRYIDTGACGRYGQFTIERLE